MGLDPPSRRRSAYLADAARPPAAPPCRRVTYAAFVTGVYSRRVVGWQLSRSLRTDLALDALEMGIWTRRGRPGRERADPPLGQRQYLAVHYTQRLAEAGTVGSTGDSYGNALAEAFNSPFKAELVRKQRPPEGHR